MLSKVLFCCGCDGCCCDGGGATGSDNDRRSAVADGVLLTGWLTVLAAFWTGLVGSGLDTYIEKTYSFTIMHLLYQWELNFNWTH